MPGLPGLQWLVRQQGRVSDRSAAAKASEYSLGRWTALTRYLDDGDLLIDDNHIENRIRPEALRTGLFAGSLRAGLRVARRSRKVHGTVRQAAASGGLVAISRRPNSEMHRSRQRASEVHRPSAFRVGDQITVKIVRNDRPDRHPSANVAGAKNKSSTKTACSRIQTRYGFAPTFRLITKLVRQDSFGRPYPPAINPT